ncbi:MAG: hypothetical protein U1F52_10725 [Burkholderiales bacterium]
MVNSSTLLTALQNFLGQRKVDPETLTAEPMVLAMLDWFRFVSIEGVERGSPADVLIYRYAGWSEGCATGFKLSLLRRVTERTASGETTEWFAGITLLFDPARYAATEGFSTVSTDWPSLEAFLHAIESSPAYRMSRTSTPMSVVVESGGMR